MGKELPEEAVLAPETPVKSIPPARVSGVGECFQYWSTELAEKGGLKENKFGLNQSHDQALFKIGSESCGVRSSSTSFDDYGENLSKIGFLNLPVQTGPGFEACTTYGDMVDKLMTSFSNNNSQVDNCLANYPKDNADNPEAEITHCFYKDGALENNEPSQPFVESAAAAISKWTSPFTNQHSEVGNYLATDDYLCCLNPKDNTDNTEAEICCFNKKDELQNDEQSQPFVGSAAAAYSITRRRDKDDVNSGDVVCKLMSSFTNQHSEVGNCLTTDDYPRGLNPKDNADNTAAEINCFNKNDVLQNDEQSQSFVGSAPASFSTTRDEHHVNLNNHQSRKKPKKKKYWPKVLVEGKQKSSTPNPRTSKLSTPKPRTPKPSKHVTSSKKCTGTQDDKTSARRALNFNLSLHGKIDRAIIHQYQRRKKKMDRPSNDSESIVKLIQSTDMSMAERGAINHPTASNSLKVYQRVFRVNQCQMNSRKLGPNFPSMWKKRRTSRRKATILSPLMATEDGMEKQNTTTYGTSPSIARSSSRQKYSTGRQNTTVYGASLPVIAADSSSQRIPKETRTRRRKATILSIFMATEDGMEKKNTTMNGTSSSIVRRSSRQKYGKGRQNTTVYGASLPVIAADNSSQRIPKETRMRRRKATKYGTYSSVRAADNEQRWIKSRTDLVPNFGEMLLPSKAQSTVTVDDCSLSLAPLVTSKKKRSKPTRRLNLGSPTLIGFNPLPLVPLAHPIVPFNYFSNPGDLEQCVNGTCNTGDVPRNHSMEDFNVKEWFGGQDFRYKCPPLPIDQSNERLMGEFCSLNMENLQGDFSIASKDVVARSEGLHISNEGGQLIVQDQNAHGADGEHKAVIAYNTKKRKPLPKADIDQETVRVWKLLMGNGGEDVEEETNNDKDKWWEEQRKVLRGRVDSFIARMHLVQGDRRFSPWKGSVVDSVVGVFLTQNVSDHLSSSAFMSLAAKYPLQSTTNHQSSDDVEISYSRESTGSNIGAVEQPLVDPTSNQPLFCEIELNVGHQLVERKVTEVGETISYGAEDITIVQDEFSPQDFLDPLIDGNLSSSCKLSTIERFSGFTEIAQVEETTYLQEFSNCDGLGRHASLCLPYSQKLYSDITPIPSDLVFSQEILTEFTNIKTKDVGDSNKNLRCEESSGTENIVLQNATPRVQKAAVGQCPSLSKYQVLPECSSHAEVEQPKGQSVSKNYRGGSKIIHKTETPVRKEKKKVEEKLEKAIDWDDLRKTYTSGRAVETTSNASDSLDWERVRQATVDEVADAIKGRGQHRILAERIKDFLDRVVRDHGSINLEWLRDVPPDKAKDYLLSIKGLGLKSVECVRLLTLHHHAFPVDTNVGRVAVRLGWVPLQPLPESLQIHLLEQYPLMDTIQVYLWPRLCTLDQLTLYELHCHLITIGKVFCRKRKPHCNACPMKGECKHFASAFASARLSLPGPQEKSMMSSMVPDAAVQNSTPIITPAIGFHPDTTFIESRHQTVDCEPIVEHPPSPSPDSAENLERDIEDFYYESEDDDIPTIRLDAEVFKETIKEYLYQYNIPLEEGDMSTALVALTSEAASIPVPKLKAVSRLKTLHQVYELPDYHPILAGLDKREPDDPSPYLLAIWMSGETENSSKPPQRQCNSQGSELCNEDTCFSCDNIQDQKFQTVCGTILIPCRTATRGSFPLNGTYFQVNEVFADDESSQRPLNIPRTWIWNLRRRSLYCGAYGSAIFRGLSTAEIQHCFWRGFICVRGFNRKTRAPAHLSERFHISTITRGKRKFTEE